MRTKLTQQESEDVETESFLTFLKKMWENWKESIEKTTISLSDYNGQTSTDYKELEIKSLTHLLSRNDIKNIEDMSRFDTIGGAMRTGSFASGSFVINIYALACASRKFIEWAHMCGDKYHNQKSNIDKFGCYIGESLCRACGAAASVFIDPFTMPIITFVETLSREIKNEFKGFTFSLQKSPKAVLKFCKVLCTGIIKGVGKAVVALADTGVKAAISVVNLSLTVLGRPLNEIKKKFTQRFGQNIQPKIDTSLGQRP